MGANINGLGNSAGKKVEHILSRYRTIEFNASKSAASFSSQPLPTIIQNNLNQGEIFNKMTVNHFYSIKNAEPARLYRVVLSIKTQERISRGSGPLDKFGVYECSMWSYVNILLTALEKRASYKLK